MSYLVFNLTCSYIDLVIDCIVDRSRFIHISIKFVLI